MAIATEQEILDVLAEVVEMESGVEPAEVTPDKSFVDDLDIDSLSVMTIVVATELRFGVQVPDEEIHGLRTVGDVITRIRDAQIASGADAS